MQQQLVKTEAMNLKHSTEGHMGGLAGVKEKSCNYNLRSKNTKLGENSGGEIGKAFGRHRMGCGFDQNTLHVCVQFSVFKFTLLFSLTPVLACLFLLG